MVSADVYCEISQRSCFSVTVMTNAPEWEPDGASQEIPL